MLRSFDEIYIRRDTDRYVTVRWFLFEVFIRFALRTKPVVRGFGTFPIDFGGFSNGERWCRKQLALKPFPCGLPPSVEACFLFHSSFIVGLWKLCIMPKVD